MESEKRRQLAGPVLVIGFGSRSVSISLLE
jgi:hypothetical protein